MERFNETLSQDDVEDLVDGLIADDMQDNAASTEFQADDALDVSCAFAEGNFQYI